MSEQADREVEDALGALAPAVAQISRDDVLFAAGRRFERRRARIWKGLGGAAVAALAVAMVWRPATPPAAVTVERIVYVERQTPPPGPSPVMIVADVPPPPPSTPPSLDSGYFALRERVLSRGLGALPAAPTATMSTDVPLEIRPLLGRRIGDRL